MLEFVSGFGVPGFKRLAVLSWLAAKSNISTGIAMESLLQVDTRGSECAAHGLATQLLRQIITFRLTTTIAVCTVLNMIHRLDEKHARKHHQLFPRLSPERQHYAVVNIYKCWWGVPLLSGYVFAGVFLGSGCDVTPAYMGVGMAFTGILEVFDLIRISESDSESLSVP